MSGGAMGVPATVVDRFDGRRSVAGTGALSALSRATILAAADVRTALTMGELAGEGDEMVLLAAALAVRAVRFGHVYVELSTVAETAMPDDEIDAVGSAGDVGDVGAFGDALVDAPMFELPWPDPSAWVAAVAASGLVAVGAEGPADRPLRLVGDRLYLDRYWRHEQTIAEELLRRADGPQPVVDEPLLRDGLARLFPPTSGGPPIDGGDGADPQRLAAASAVLRRFAVIAGGPGTGKTTTVARIIALLHEQADAFGQLPPRIALAAPTGKAAARLEEAVHAEVETLDIGRTIVERVRTARASTLHRLLGWQRGNRFRHDAGNQLPHQVVIVDESSMVSLSMMAKLLVAVRPHARLVLVGDARQLASVEAGAVLGDIVGPAVDGLHLRPPAQAALSAATGFAVTSTDPGAGVAIGDGTVVLRRVHRFGGAIAALATAIEDGDVDHALAVLRSGAPDVEWIATSDDAGSGHQRARDPRAFGDQNELLRGVRDVVVRAASDVVARAQTGDGVGALAALRSVQVLCAHRRGPAGATAWQLEIERWLRSAMPGYAVGTWYAGRPLLVTENDYTLGVFNGDTGVVIDGGGGRLRAVFDRRGEVLAVRPTRLASVESLYAMTIHKAQGSQFGCVVVVLPDASSAVLTRELLYTAVTRAQRRLMIVGAEASLAAAINRPIARASGLRERLWTPPTP